MAAASLNTIAFAPPGGEVSTPSQSRPIDLSHLERQTFGDRALEREVLSLFVQQAATVKARIAGATSSERAFMAHGLRGSAGGVGATRIAELARAIEEKPDDRALVARLSSAIDEARNFVAAIYR